MIIIVVPVGVVVAYFILTWLLDSELVEGCLSVVAALIAVPLVGFFAWFVLEVLVEAILGEGMFPGPDEVLLGAHN